MILKLFPGRSFFLFLIFSGFFLSSQNIYNAYASVSAISGNSVLTLSSVDQSNHTFAVGEDIIIMQMQDDVIGTNTTNVSTFGNISSIASAGLFEGKTILSISPASGTPTSVTVASPLFNTYNTATTSAVQIISFRNLGSNFTTTASITGAAWNGSIGGVIAIQTSSTMTLSHSITANGLGFRGGAASSSADEACANSVYITSSSLKAYKGEGIQKNYNSSFSNGRGHIASGGGGGSQNNTGGGGGANYSAGGNGGLGWNCTSGNSGYGLGGASLSSYISGTRIFMGGAGGGGQQNNNVGTSGGNGGGIVLIRTGTLITTNACAGLAQITANGSNAVNSGNDGAGGGGAGGSIIVQANNFSLSATCPLTVSANGGNGGSVGNSGSHGGGGAGGQGVVIFSSSQPASNASVQTNNGTAGANSSASGSTSAGSAGGSNGGGVISGTVTILPIELVSFYSVRTSAEQVMLRWCTAQEKNTSHFIVERSYDGIGYTSVGNRPAAGNSQGRLCYELTDAAAGRDLVYYRLITVNADGSRDYSPLIAEQKVPILDFSVSPNPLSSHDILILHHAATSAEFRLLDFFGRAVFTIRSLPVATTTEIDLDAIQAGPGIYYLQNTGSAEVRKVLVLD